jgi:bacteriocin biosynthesis cyclodehydratase domain-containing protein
MDYREDGRRLRSDVSIAEVEGATLMRYGTDQTLRMTGESPLQAHEAELQERGLLVTGAPERDWQLALCGRLIAGKAFVAGADDEIVAALSAAGMACPEEDAAAGLFFERGVDLTARGEFERKMRARGLSWLWIQSQAPGELRWSVFDPRETACSECLETRLRANRSNASEYAALLRMNSERLPAVVMPPLSRIAAGVAMVELARLLGGAVPPSLGRLCTLDLLSWESTRERLFPVPGCEGCRR